VFPWAENLNWAFCPVFAPPFFRFSYNLPRFFVFFVFRSCFYIGCRFFSFYIGCRSFRFLSNLGHQSCFCPSVFSFFVQFVRVSGVCPLIFGFIDGVVLSLLHRQSGAIVFPWISFISRAKAALHGVQAHNKSCLSGFSDKLKGSLRLRARSFQA
jgi:hypothetical protein